MPAPPPGLAPAGFPATPTQLASGGTTDLKDTGGTTYLTIAPTNPATWPPSFGVLTQDDISDPTKFNLLVVYAPAVWRSGSSDAGSASSSLLDSISTMLPL